MSTDGGGELTKRRPLPEWMYAYPDKRSERIADLEAALIESNDIASHAFRAASRAAKDIAYSMCGPGDEVAAKAMEIASYYWRVTAEKEALSGERALRLET